MRNVNAEKLVLAGLGLLGLLFAVIFGFIVFRALALRPIATPAAVAAPTGTLTPVMTPAGSLLPTAAPTLTPRYTRIPEGQNIPYNLPPAPKGFTWKVMPELLMDVLIPDGWYYTQRLTDDVDEFYVTKEFFDIETGKYSTGMSVKIYRETENVDESANEYIFNLTFGETTKKVVDSMQVNSKSNTITLYSLLLESEFPDLEPGDPNHKKKMVCNAIADIRNKTLYLMVFESPLALWDEEWNARGGPVTLSVINLLFAGR